MNLNNYLDSAKKGAGFVAIIQENIASAGNYTVITYTYWQLSPGKQDKVKRFQKTVLVRNIGKSDEAVLEEEA